LPISQLQTLVRLRKTNGATNVIHEHEIGAVDAKAMSLGNAHRGLDAARILTPPPAGGKMSLDIAFYRTF
jgi:hypothetical protein